MTDQAVINGLYRELLFVAMILLGILLINNLKANGYTVHTTQPGKYTVYTVGDCKTREQASALKQQLIGQGFAESYVATFVNGVKQN